MRIRVLPVEASAGMLTSTGMLLVKVGSQAENFFTRIIKIKILIKIDPDLPVFCIGPPAIPALTRMYLLIPCFILTDMEVPSVAAITARHPVDGSQTNAVYPFF